MLGIGKETARKLAKMGANLIITAREVERGKKCVEDLILESNNPRIQCRYLDLCDFKSIHNLGEELLRELTHLDILINCAGMGSFAKSQITNDGNQHMYLLRRINPPLSNRRLQTNFLGPCLLTYRLLPLLTLRAGTSKRPTRIVNVVSEAHYVCPSFTIPQVNTVNISPESGYICSKFLLLTSTMALAEQLREKNIVVHAVCPGISLTEFFDKFPSWHQRVYHALGYLGIGKSVSEAADNIMLGMFSGVYMC
jgi:retinol dehydrogenase-12